MPKKKTGSKLRAKQIKTAQKLKIRRRRPLHKKLLLHPITVFILLCTGVLLVGITYKTYSNNIQVVAKVSAPLPTAPAAIKVIITGSDSTTGQTKVLVDSHSSDLPVVRVTSSVITLRGECPADTYVKIYRNGVSVGDTMCVGDPTFAIPIELLPGENVLKAQVFNITDDAGPILPAIYIIYDQSANNNQTTSVTSSGSSGQPSSRTGQSRPTGNLSPFIITSQYQYKAVLVGETYSLEMSLSGGLPPYALNINWGDGKQSTIVQKAATTFAVDHVYKTAGTGEHQDFTVKIQGADSANQTAFLQTMAIVKSKSSPSVVAATGSNNETGLKSLLGSTKRWLLVAWPAYTIITLMAVSFWLGEREKLVMLRRHNHLRGRRA